MPITAARQNLMNLAKSANRRMDRYILTSNGHAQAVLLGHADYQSLVASARLAHHPEVLRDTYAGFTEIRDGAGINLDELQEFTKRS